ncbi:hypothetical protein F5Y15DRAFT_428528 [Xylariaceae sp. FL0016]|nr:hypothetical protein F5Y15DRAFT_428528 [Xylariaceae sp. FL0016]
MSSPTATETIAAESAASTRESIRPLLPTCQRCRRLRRKCDTQLPNCRLCEKAGVECAFQDHALKQALPRAYVHSLLVRLDQLRAVKNGITASPPHAGPARSTQASQPTPLVLFPQHRSEPESKPDDAESFDVVIPSQSTAGKSRYWGSSSVFALAVEIIHHAHAKGLVPQDSTLLVAPDETTEDTSADNGPFHRDISLAPASDIEALISLYMVSMNTLYGFVDEAAVPSDVRAYLALRPQPGPSSSSASPPAHALHGRDAHRYFRVTMMCAIACASQARYRPSRAAESLAYHADAVAFVEEVTSEVSPASLQALLLLIVFCLFFPRRGDIWKLLDYACRLTVELGYHTEQDPDTAPDDTTTSSAAGSRDAWQQPPEQGADGDGDERRRKLRRSTFWGLYAIERIVGQLFGRGTDLPETIITTEYPSDPPRNNAITTTTTTTTRTMDTASSPPAVIDQGPHLQPPPPTSVIAHHYRLVYLRSELFRALYLPATPPDLGPSWLRDRHAALHAWRRELAVSPDDAGVATVTCDVGYDATICFLFQPLTLRALRRTRTPQAEEDIADSAGTLAATSGPGDRDGAGGGRSDGLAVVVAAADSFWSSCNLIRTYEKVIRAPEASVLGTYPMTFMSAHYIWIASSTLLAHALLAVDGRAEVLPRFSSEVMAEGAEGNGAEGGVDLGVFVDISGSCLILLSWCVERWPGMAGMLEVYQMLFRKLTREVIRKGLV